MDPNRYFEEHWREIEPERLDRYELMFTWRPEQEALIAPARIQAGQTVLDLGSGPGHLAVEPQARIVGVALLLANAGTNYFKLVTVPKPTPE
jgi:cyclopropane fatty-acyl-phospholipid synthase-like methyltransferase